MNIEAIREQISAYIDNELVQAEKSRVEKLIKTDSLWKAEYKALQKTAIILSRMEKIAVPQDMVKRISTTVSLSKSGVLRRHETRLALSLPKSPVFQYAALIIAAALIVFAGSLFILRHKESQQEKIVSSIKDEKWMDTLVYKRDKEMVKEGYKWYFLNLEKDGSFRIVHIGESKPKELEKTPLATQVQPPPGDQYAAGRQTPSVPGEAQPSDENRRALAYSKDVKKGTAAASSEMGPSAAATESIRDKKTTEKKTSVALGAADASKAKTDQVDKDHAEESASVKSAPPAAAEKEISSQAAKQSARPQAARGEARKGEGETAENLQREPSAGAKHQERENETDARKRDAGRKNIFDGEESALETIVPRLISVPKINIKNRDLIKNQTLIVGIEILSDGTVNDVQIIEGSGDRWLDIAVRKALLKARFTPPTVATDETTSFKLKINIK